MAYEIITKQQEEMIDMLIEGKSISDIARILKVTRNTIYAWKDKECIKAELDKRKQLLIHQGNDLILKDITSYVDQIKALAKDVSDKRVCLAANQYLLNRIYGSPSGTMEDDSSNTDENIPENDLEKELNRFKKLRAIK